MATTSSVTLRGDWVPENQANCLKPDDIWQWDYGIPEDRRTVVGAPSQTRECLPKGWSRAMTYEGTQCPPRYTEACQATEESLAVVCCPTLHDFSCQPSSDLATGPHASVFRCMSRYTDTGSWVVTQTYMPPQTGTTLVTPTYNPAVHLFALAIIYATPTPTPDSSSSSDTVSQTASPITSTASAPTSSSSDESSGGSLSAGASAGIGVGAAAGAILLGLAGWLLYRRRKKSSGLRTQSPDTGPMHQEGGYGYSIYQHGNTDPTKSHTQSLRSELPPNGPHRPELSSQTPVELGS